MSPNITHCVIARQGKKHNAHHDKLPILPENSLMSDMGRQYFAEWRKLRGLTQAQAAELTGIQQGLLSALERASRRYNADHLEAMAQAYLCEVWELLGKDPTDSDESSAIADIWEHIPARNKPHARQILETFADKKKA
jgi:transcriptional regulator with XRE-family HTH domain